MLSTSPRSRRRLAAGGALVSTLVLAGLGMTASGTSAAAAISGKVGRTIGADLQDAPPAPPAPPAPAMPADPALPAAPPAPPVPAAEGKVRHVVVKRVDKDGKVSTYTSSTDGRFDDAAIQAMVDRSLKMAPEVRERRCVDGRDGAARELVVNSEAGGKRMMVICTNRIEAMASSGAAAAAHADAMRVNASAMRVNASAMRINAEAIRRNAMATALASVAASRADIAANRAMADADRTKALAEMDAAMAELRAEAAETDKD